MNFTFATANQIRFGQGVLAELPVLVAERGSRPILISGSSPERYLSGVELEFCGQVSVSREPTFEDIAAAVAVARQCEADVVVGLGGGAAIDVAKAVGVLAVQDGEVMDYAEVIGGGKPLAAKSLPVIAVPTTAGTGSEVSANSVAASIEHRVKVSLRSPVMLPAVALVDPLLTLTCPKSVTTNSGLDALTQCIEPYTSRLANPLTDAIALTGFKAGSTALPTAVADGSNVAAREAMSQCSLFGGLGLANAKLGAVHGFAGVLGGLTGAPHGAICGSLLAAVTETNVLAMREREPENPALAKYGDLAFEVTGDRDPQALVGWLIGFVAGLSVPSIKELGLKPQDVEAAVAGASRASSMKGNPIVLTDAELHQILAAS